MGNNGTAQMSAAMIDWHSQWELHAPNFHGGFAHVDVGQGMTVRMLPGPGFGDFSHPTTRLTLKLMQTYAKNKILDGIVVDLGCGSGVLSLAAAKLGAKKVYGIDICEEAIEHAQKNAKVNDLKISFGKTANLVSPQEILLVMNMISSEQQVAWESHPYLHDLQGMVITSGILVEQKESYLAQAAKRGWIPVEFAEESDWLAIAFQRKS